MAPFDGDVTEHEALVQPKPDVFSVEGLRDWLRTQDPAREYDWTNCLGRCLIGLYAWDVTRDEDRGFELRFHTWLSNQDLLWIASGRTTQYSNDSRHTFGAALSRCDAYLARTGA